MSYPSLEKYNEAFQHPQTALTDPELKKGTITTTGLGLPLALCGGFALTYTINTGQKKYAVRCFHKQSNSLEKRYSAISSRLKNLQSPYFVDFEFQPNGVRVAGSTYPVVKMAWASGKTLGEFLEANYRNPSNLQNLSSSLRTLANYLSSQKMAHGDIQPGNLMVADSGKKLQLIDYDGIFLEELKTLGSSELGHRNFQHPNRSSTSWDTSLDRFSFICLDLAVRVLAVHPELWDKTQSDGDSILFKANDFADPTQSVIFSTLYGKNGFSEEAKNFAAICKSTFFNTPSLDDFLARKNIPQIVVAIKQTHAATIQKYLSAFPVLDAKNYSACFSHVGDKIELIGQIFEVKEDNTRHGKPYVFINFGPWQGHIVKLSIWSEGLQALNNKPTVSWVGKWISVVGLVEPPFISKKYKYSHLSINITQGTQLRLISEQEAKFRLAGSATRGVTPSPSSSNQEILKRLNGGKVPEAIPSIVHKARNLAQPPATPPVTSNQAILQKMRSTSTPPSAPSSSYRQHTGTQTNKTTATNSNCFIATAVYGPDAFETNTLREFRDKNLLPSFGGRIFVAIYYKISPGIAEALKRNQLAASLSKLILDGIVRVISKKNK